MSTYNLQKGESYVLAKSMSKCYVGLGWDVNTNNSSYSYDLDVVALLLGKNGKLLSNGVVFYNNPTYPSCQWQHNGARNETLIQQQPVWLSGDNRSGVGDGDDEFIHIDLQRIPQEITEILIAVVIYEAAIRKQSLKDVPNAFVRLSDAPNMPDKARYEIKNQEFTTESCLAFCKIYRGTNGWTFEALGKATNFDLSQLINHFTY